MKCICAKMSLFLGGDYLLKSQTLSEKSDFKNHGELFWPCVLWLSGTSLRFCQSQLGEEVGEGQRRGHFNTSLCWFLRMSVTFSKTLAGAQTLR